MYDFSKFENSYVELPYLNSCSQSHFPGGFGGQNTLCAPRNALDEVFSGRRHLVPTISLSRTTKLDLWRSTACENREIREFIHRILQTKKITDRYFSVSNLIPRRFPVTSGIYSGYLVATSPVQIHKYEVFNKHRGIICPTPPTLSEASVNQSLDAIRSSYNERSFGS